MSRIEVFMTFLWRINNLFSLSLLCVSAIIVILHWLLFLDCQKSNPMSSALSLVNVPTSAEPPPSPQLNHHSSTSAV